MADEGMVGARELYVEATNNLRFVKGQQWTLAYYAVVLAVALYWAHDKSRLIFSSIVTNGECWVDGLATLLVVLALAAGVGIALSYQFWIRKERERLNRLYAMHADKRFLDANRERGGNQFIDARLWRQWYVWTPQIAVQVFAFGWVLTIIWAPYFK
jgi:hypothetical protein